MAFDAVASPFTPGQDLAGLHAVAGDFFAFEHTGAAWRSEDGRLFTANGRFMLNFNQGQVKADRFELRCIGDDTILP